MMENFVLNNGKSFLLKDKLINLENLERVALDIKKVYIDFQKENFIYFILEDFENLELKERISKIVLGLNNFLPKDFNLAIDILIKSLPIKEKNEDIFIYASFSEFVLNYGLNKKNLKKSFFALSIFTKYFSSEFAIRIFINEFEKESLEFLEDMVKQKNFKQQRLASEGLRPKLPWGKKIKINYKLGAKFLDELYYNKNRVVTRSVANHLHDISKFDKLFVLNKLKNFQRENKQNKKELDYIIKHSLRTLIKKGDLDVLKFLGYKTDLNLILTDFNFKRDEITLGDYFEFSFNLRSNEDCNLIIDYIIYYPNKTLKIFKFKNIKLTSNNDFFFEKRHKFVPMSTKKLYFGEYGICIQINGKKYSKKTFILK